MNVKNLLTPPIDASHGFIRILKGLSKKVYPRLREFLSQIEAKINQTWDHFPAHPSIIFSHQERTNTHKFGHILLYLDSCVGTRQTKVAQEGISAIYRAFPLKGGPQV